MKTWQKIAIGTAAAVSIGAIGYALYESYQPVLQELQQSSNEIINTCGKGISSKKFKYSQRLENNSDSMNSSHDEINLIDILDQVLVESMENILIYTKIAAEIYQERPNEREELATQIKKQSDFYI